LDDLLHNADQTARAMGLSLRRRQHEQMVEQLNRAYSDQTSADEPSTAIRIKMKFRATIKDRW